MPRKSKSEIGRFGKLKKAEYIRLLREDGRFRMAAAKEIGVSYTTILNHLKSDPEFAEAVQLAEMESNEGVVSALYEAAIAGDVNAMKMWLSHRDPQNWSDHKNIHLTADVRREDIITLRGEIDVRPEQLADPSTIRDITSIFKRLGSPSPNRASDDSIEGEVVAVLPSPGN